MAGGDGMTDAAATSSSSSSSYANLHHGALDQFVLLAKSASGAAAKALVEQAVSAPDVYVFGELLSCPKIAEMEKSADTKAHYDLLRLFAYGTFDDFVQTRTSLPQLSEPMLLKLRQLTISSLAADCRRIPYNQLMNTLQLNNVRELEDVVIDAVYKGVLRGKLDPKDQLLEVESWQGRDVRPEQIPDLINVLGEWTDRCQHVLYDIEGQIKLANASKQHAVQEEARVDAEVANLKKTLKMNASNRNTTPEGDLDDPISEVSSSRLDSKSLKQRQRAGLRGSKPVMARYGQAQHNGNH